MSIRANNGLPQNSISSMATYFSSINGVSKEEKALLVRIGTLIDAIVNSERGLSNVGGTSKRELDQSQETVDGDISNVLRSVQVDLTKVDSKSLSHYEVEVDTDSNFSDPTSYNSFAPNLNIKGLTPDSDYSVRVRQILKNGTVSDWNELGSILITAFSVILEATDRGDIAETAPITYERTGLETLAGGTHVGVKDNTVPTNKPDFFSTRDGEIVQKVSFRVYEKDSGERDIIHSRLGVPVFFDIVDDTTEGDHTFAIFSGFYPKFFYSREPASWVVF